jgi:hypothetical protein
MFPLTSGVAMGQGAAALALALDSTSVTVNIDISGIDPGAGGTAESNAGQVDVTASASGGDSSSYAYAWVVTENPLSDPLGEYAVLAAGTQNAAQYNTLTIQVTATAIPNFPPQSAEYRLRCTVTDGAGAKATADFTLTVA